MSTPPLTQRRLPDPIVWDCVDRYEVALRQLPSVDVRDFFPPESSPSYHSTAIELLRITIEHSWSHGQSDVLTKMLDALPWVRRDKQLLAEIAFEDYRQANAAGVSVAAAEYAERFEIDVSQWGDGLRRSGVSDASVEQDDSQQSSANTFRESTPTETSGARQASTRYGSQRVDGGIRESWKRLEQYSRFDEFELLGLLGKGAFSRVYLALQTKLASRPVVLKITASPLRESERLARLQHEGIVPVYSIHHDQGLYAICMPLLGSATLQEFIASGARDAITIEGQSIRWNSAEGQVGPLEPALEEDDRRLRMTIQRASDRCASRLTEAGYRGRMEASSNQTSTKRTYVDAMLEIGCRLAQALQHAHDRGVLHRDVKPANVLLTDRGDPMLLDFNLAEVSDDQFDLARSVVGGTLPYMSPEQLRAMRGESVEVTAASDVYALGVVLYQLLTGRLPHAFDATQSSDIDRAFAEVQKPFLSPSQLNPKVSPAVTSIVMKCLAIDLSRRYVTAGQVAEDLRRQLNHQPLRFASDRSMRERATKFLRRHPQLRSTSLLITLLTAASVALAFGGVAWNYERSQQEALRRFDQFVASARNTEASLFFPDGGSSTTGIDRGIQTLALYEVLGESDWTQQASVQNLPETQKRQLILQTAQLLSLLSRHVMSRDDQSDESLIFTSSITHTEVDSAELLRESQRILEKFDSTDSSRVEASANDPLLVASDKFLLRDFRAAIEVLEEAIETEPERFALWFLAGKCHYELREYREADGCFAAAARIDSTSALSLVARAACQYWQQDFTRSLSLLDQAEQLDSSIASLYANRALNHERLNDLAAALKAIDRAIELESESLRHRSVRSRLRRAAGDVAGAEDDFSQLRQVVPRDGEGWILRGLARLSVSAEDAIADFRRAASFPESRPIALQNVAHVQSEILGDRVAAIETLDELLADYPDFLPARTGRAVLHARQGDRVMALEDVQAVPASSLTPQLHYQIACVYSLLSSDDPSLTELAFEHLSKSLAPAYGSAILASDADLKPLAELPRFQAISAGITALSNNIDEDNSRSTTPQPTRRVPSSSESRQENAP